MVLEVGWSRACADGGGFHALYWNMLGWFGFFTRVFQGFLFGREERVGVGGFMSWLGCAVVGRGIGGWVRESVARCILIFFGGLFDGCWGGDSGWCWM